MALWKRVRFVLLLLAGLLLLFVVASFRSTTSDTDTGFSAKPLPGVRQVVVVRGDNAGGTAVLRQFELMGAFAANSSGAILRSRDNLRAHQLLAEQVERRPEATAVVYADERLSYGELKIRANRLAHRLRATPRRARELPARALGTDGRPAASGADAE